MATTYLSIGTVSAPITSSTNTSPIQIDVGIHYLKFSVGQHIKVAGHATNTNANGSWRISAIDVGLNRLTLEGSNTSGAIGTGGTVTRDHTSVQSWIAATTGALGGNIKRGEWYDDDGLGLPVANSGTQIVLTGATGASATAYRELISFNGASLNGTQHRHNPINLTGARIIKTIGNPLGDAIVISEDYARVTGVGVYCVDSAGVSTGGPYYGVKVTSSFNQLDSVYVEYPVAAVDGNVCFAHTAGTDLLAKNCIAVGGTDALGAKFGYQSARANDRFLNCNAYHCRYTGAAHGFDVSGSGATVKNCIALENNNTGGSSSDFLIGGSVVFTNCIDSDNSASGGLSCISYETALNAWNYADYRDFRNKTTARAKANGIDLSATFTTDFAGTTRTAPWEIGAYDGDFAPTFTAPTEIITPIADVAAFAAWKALTDKHLVAANERHWGELDGAVFAFGASIQTMSGATSDSTRYRGVRAASGQAYDTVSDIGARITGTGAQVLSIAEDYFRLERVKVENTGAGADRECVRSTGRFVRIDAILAKSTASSGGSGSGIYALTGTGQLILNSICVGSGSGAAGMNFGVRCTAPSSLVANCIGHKVKGAGGVGKGFLIGAATSRAVNCIGADNTTDFDSAASALSDFNLSSDTTAPGSHSLVSKASSTVFYNLTAGDYRLKSSSPALNVGQALGSVFSDDFAGINRTAPWEMGAYNGFAFDPPTAAIAPGETQYQCTLWKIERRDGYELHFTDHCRPVDFRGQRYTPISGVDSTARRSESGLRDANLEVAGVVDGAAITFDDLRAGRYGEARITEYLANWLYPDTEPRLTTIFFFGALTCDGIGWNGDLSGPANKLQREQGRNHSRPCGATVGDSRCTINVFPLSALGQTVTSVPASRYLFRASALSGGFADNYFRYGHVIWTSGLNVGIESEFKASTQSTREFELQEETPFDIQIGDTFDAIVGCDGLRSTCSAKFNNLVNHRGDPFMVGTDRLLGTPQR